MYSIVDLLDHLAIGHARMHRCNVGADHDQFFTDKVFGGRRVGGGVIKSII